MAVNARNPNSHGPMNRYPIRLRCRARRRAALAAVGWALAGSATCRDTPSGATVLIADLQRHSQPMTSLGSGFVPVQRGVRLPISMGPGFESVRIVASPNCHPEPAKDLTS